MRRRRKYRVTSRSFSSGVTSLLLLIANFELLYVADTISGFRCVYSVC